MATRKTPPLADHRKALGLTQRQFWNRFGVTQSAASRFEGGRPLTNPLKILFWLHQQGIVTNEHLAQAQASIQPRKPRKRP